MPTAPRVMTLTALTIFGACADAPVLIKLKASATLSSPTFPSEGIGQASHATASLRNTGARSGTITSITVSGPFALTSDSVKLIGTVVFPNAVQALQITGRPTSVGANIGTLEVGFADEALTVPLSVQGEPSRRPELVSTDVVDFGARALNMRHEAVVTLHNRGDGQGTITAGAFATLEGNVESTAFSVDSLPRIVDPGASVSIPVVFAPSRLGEHTAWVLLDIAETGQQSAVRLVGTGQDILVSGRLSCDPAFLDFGPQQRGAETSLTVDCVAVGGAVEVERATATGPFGAGAVTSGLWLEGVVHTIALSFDTVVLAGDHRGSFEIGYRSEELSHSTAIGLSGQVLVPTPQTTALTARLRWTETVDLDIHLAPLSSGAFGAEDCYFARRQADWGRPNDASDDPHLDVDDLSGPGPETINVDELPDGNYGIYVHYFGADFDSAPSSEATVEVFIDGATVATPTRMLTNCNDLWLVGQVRSENGQTTFLPVDSVDRSNAGACLE